MRHRLSQLLFPVRPPARASINSFKNSPPCAPGKNGSLKNGSANRLVPGGNFFRSGREPGGPPPAAPYEGRGFKTRRVPQWAQALKHLHTILLLPQTCSGHHKHRQPLCFCTLRRVLASRSRNPGPRSRPQAVPEPRRSHTRVLTRAHGYERDRVCPLCCRNAPPGV